MITRDSIYNFVKKGAKKVVNKVTGFIVDPTIKHMEIKAKQSKKSTDDLRRFWGGK